MRDHENYIPNGKGHMVDLMHYKGGVYKEYKIGEVNHVVLVIDFE